jgi:tRNA pseudouridine55 synthase
MSAKAMVSEGLLLVDKPAGIPSFRLVSQLRRLTGIRKIGHAGTLDPFATGVMVMLLGRKFTRLSDTFLTNDKEYLAEIRLGITTDSYDCDGAITAESPLQPELPQIEEALTHFQGCVMQLPPIYSAKKVAGRKMYELARKGIEVERTPVAVEMTTHLLSYDYPFLTVRVSCSKGTYIRTIGYDLGERLGCGAHLTALRRLRSGPFPIEECLDGEKLNQPEFDVRPYLRQPPPCS